MTEKGEGVRGTHKGASKVTSEGHGRIFWRRYCAEREETERGKEHVQGFRRCEQSLLRGSFVSCLMSSVASLTSVDSGKNVKAVT